MNDPLAIKTSEREPLPEHADELNCVDAWDTIIEQWVARYWWDFPSLPLLTDEQDKAFAERFTHWRVRR